MNAIIAYDITKYRVRRKSHSKQYALLSVEQHAHFLGMLRPADEK